MPGQARFPACTSTQYYGFLRRTRSVAFAFGFPVTGDPVDLKIRIDASTGETVGEG
jgi:hypothetical protein